MLSYVAACSEFPNDNPGLHHGAIWRCAELRSAPAPELPAASRDEALCEDDGAPIEIVDDLAFDVEASGARPGDPFAKLAGVLADVARTFGAGPDAEAHLDGLLGLSGAGAPVPAQVAAWQGILRGESEDFDACGPATLDEWAAGVVASVVGASARADGIRRELRRRGVAAFGLVESAAA